MIWFVLFFILTGVAVFCTYAFVPIEHVRNYGRSRKDSAYYLAGFLCIAILAVAIAQHILAPDPFSAWLKITGVGFWVIGQVLVIWARRVNPWFLPVVIYVPPSHRVTTGPYRLMDHPGYVGFILSTKGMALMLGGWWTLFPLAAYIFLVLRRMSFEDRIFSSKVSL